jgi:YebC/PmpR family DNA-binding regulatory protein
MSGHSKWASIKHKKAALDAKRGKAFTRIIKEISVAARIGGGDPAGNPRLRTAIVAAKAANMPKDTMERAIKKGTGELGGASIEELTYEGYGPGGVAIYVVATTDNRNRTASEIRTVFTKNGGSIGAPGSVAWMFTKRGMIQVDAAAASEDAVMEAALEAGAEDVTNEGGTFTVLTAPEDLEAVREALAAKSLPILAAEIQHVPNNTVRVEGKEAERLMKLLNSLEESDDIDRVSANFDIPDDEMERLSA